MFISGGGSNARTLVEYFDARATAKVVLLVTNAPNEGMTHFSSVNGIPQVVLNGREHADGELLCSLMEAHKINAIALAGYLKMMPPALMARYPRRVFNIHPALLPRFGGKGMYGTRVHEAVIAAGEKESGMTVHLVNEVYDEGEIVFQGKVAIQPEWTAADLQHAVLVLEHRHYAPAIEHALLQLPISS